MANKFKEILEGTIKRANKAALRKSQGFQAGDADKKWAADSERQANPRVQKHQAKRGIRKSKVIEGVVKQINKAKKRDWEAGKGREINKNTIYKDSPVDNRAAHRTGTADKTLQPAHKKIKKDISNGLRKRRNAAKGKMESIVSQVASKTAISIVESTSDLDLSTKSNPDYQAIRKEKAGRAAKTMTSAKKKHTTRKEALGKMGGKFDKKGNKASTSTVTAGTEKWRGTGKREKPMPLSPKGSPGEGKAMSNVRGKTVHTSRSSGKEGQKAQASSDAFSKLVAGLSKKKG